MLKSMVNHDRLRKLLAHRGEPSITLTLPVASNGPETWHGATRLKNQVSALEKKLPADAPERSEILEWLQARVDDREFWMHQRRGLMLLAAPGVREEWRLPFDVPESLHVADRFHLKHAIHTANSPSFELLAFSQGAVRLFACDASHHREIELKDAPESLEHFLRFHEFSQEMQSHSVTHAGRPGGGPGNGSAGGSRPSQAYHASDGTSERRHDDLDRYAREVAQVVDRRRAGLTKAPWLILAGPERDLAAYRNGSHDPRICEHMIKGNFDRADPADLRGAGWEIAKTYWTQDHADAREGLEAGLAQGVATENLTGVLNAAHQGRVSMLFVARDQEVRGTFDPMKGKAQLDPNVASEASDLLDEAACVALLHGADVHVVAGTEMPNGSDVAALIRS